MPLKPRMLQIVADGTPGGGTTVVLGLCHDVMGDGRWDVTLASADDSYALSTAASLGIRAVGVAFAEARGSLSTLKALTALIDREQPALIHIHGARAGLPVSLITMLRHRRIGLVYTVHGLHFTMKPLLMRLAGALAEGVVANRSDATVYVSDGDRGKARQWRILPPASRLVRTIFNGIQPQDLDRPASVGPGLDLVFVGRLVHQKNPLFLVELMDCLRATEVTLGVVGGGELEGELKRQLDQRGLGSRVRLYGKLGRAATIDVMAGARLCVFPSRWEGLPVTPIEAAYLGLPIVASKIAGTDEVVIDGHNGRLMPQFDGRAYADTIVRLLNDPSELKRLGQNGRALVHERFMRSRCSAAYLDVYREVLDRYAPAAGSAVTP